MEEEGLNSEWKNCRKMMIRNKNMLETKQEVTLETQSSVGTLGSL